MGGRRPAGQISLRLARARLNILEPCDRHGAPGFAKRRGRLGRLLIGPANLGLRWLGADVRVLPDRAWWAWERTVHRRVYGIECEVDARGRLILPCWPGVPLADHGRDVRIAPAQRLRALASAVVALRDLHRVFTPPSDEPLSHGDAKLGNVMYDPADGRARWFDFDTVHVPGTPPTARHGDDLRALIYSALEVLPDLQVPALIAAIRAAYDDPAPWDFLRDRLARGPIHHMPHHLAQASPPLDRRREAERILSSS